MDLNGLDEEGMKRAGHAFARTYSGATALGRVSETDLQTDLADAVLAYLKVVIPGVS